MAAEAPAQLTPEQQQRKNEADVAKAEADARTAEATARKTAIEADKAAAAGLREQVAALVPDLTKVDDSSLELKETPPMWGTFLTYAALPTVADAVANALVGKGKGKNRKVLITSDPDLASKDAAYLDVSSGLEHLIRTADELLADVHVEFVDPVTGGLALAAALPGVLSLLSAKRTLSSEATVANDLAAVAAVAASLRTKAASLVVVHDDFRLVPDGPVHAQLGEVTTRRGALIAKKLTLTDEKSKTDAALAEAKAAKRPNAATIADLTRQSTDAATRIGLIESALTVIDTVLAGIRSIPSGAKRSLLATAELQASLRGQGRFTHVLLVKAQAGRVREQIDNRPLILDDKFYAIADTSVTYVLIDTDDSSIVASGTVTRLASASGNTDGPPAVQVGAQVG